MAKRPKKLSKDEIEAIFAAFKRDNPEPKGELDYINPFTLLVAVVLSAQATDAGVNKATPALFKLAPTPAKMAALGEEKIRDLIKTIGLFNTKAKNVALLAQKLIDEHGGEVPTTREVLETLPGVGRKTANVVLNIAFKQPTIAVDTHLFRVANRTEPRAGRYPDQGRARAAQGGAEGLPASRPPLADPSRPLCVQGTKARVLPLHHPRVVPVRAEDASAEGLERTRGSRGLGQPIAARHQRREDRDQDEHRRLGVDEAPRAANLAIGHDIPTIGLRRPPPAQDIHRRLDRDEADDDERGDLHPEHRVAEIEGSSRSRRRRRAGTRRRPVRPPLRHTRCRCRRAEPVAHRRGPASAASAPSP